MAGGLASSSSATTFIESAAGVAAGGRTGLVSVVTGILFLLAFPFVALVGAIPTVATAPALIIVGVLMVAVLSAGRAHDGRRDRRQGGAIDFRNLEDALPVGPDDAGDAANVWTFTMSLVGALGRIVICQRGRGVPSSSVESLR